MKYYIKISVLGFLFPFIAFAHGTGASVEKTVGDYFIDVGYSPTEIRAGEAVRFDFSLSSETTNEEVLFQNIWLRIMKDNQTVFAGGLSRARFGLTGITYTFHEKGGYEIFLRFESEDETIVETSFPFTVQSGGENPTATVFSLNSLFILLAGAVLGWLATLLGKRKKY